MNGNTGASLETHKDLHLSNILRKQIRDARPAPPYPAKRRLCPVKITKTCGAQRGKVDFNPLKFGRQFQGKDPILSDKYLLHSQISWFTHFFAPPRLKARPRTSLVQMFTSVSLLINKTHRFNQSSRLMYKNNHWCHYLWPLSSVTTGSGSPLAPPQIVQWTLCQCHT